MARILYALNGQGRGHTSRALGVAHTLRLRGHDVSFCCGDAAADRLRRRGESVLDVPAPARVVRGNRVRLLATAWRNAPLAVRTPEIVEALAERIADLSPTSSWPTSSRSRRVRRGGSGLPAVALSHQQILTETRCHVPLRYAASAALTRLGIGAMAPRGLFDRVIVPSFFFPPRRAGSDAALVPPILRPDVLAAAPRRGAHVLVYVNHPEGTSRLLDALRRVDALFVVYNVPRPPQPEAYPNLTFRAPSRRRFIDDLATCRAVVSTAGFTLLSEALHLGKPVLAVPNRGFFEQAVNALYLRRSGRGEAVLGRLTASAIERFLHAPPSVAPGGHIGNARAADHIEAACPRRTFALAS